MILRSTPRQAIAVLRRDLQRRKAGAAIIVHRHWCATGEGYSCDCTPRKLVVRAVR